MFFILNLSFPLPKEFDYVTAEQSVTQEGRAGLHKWRCKTFFFPSDFLRRFWGINGALLPEDGLLDIMCFLFCCTQVQLFFVWMDILTQMDIFQHTKHPNMDSYKVVFDYSILIQTDTPAHQSTQGPLPWRWGLHFLTWTILLQFFCPLHSTFLPTFFCSQSSVSLDCIWNYRSSYHSLKRLVCPALCILAVLSNPLVWTPVSLHFPH